MYFSKVEHYIISYINKDFSSDPDFNNDLIYSPKLDSSCDEVETVSCIIQEMAKKCTNTSTNTICEYKSIGYKYTSSCPTSLDCSPYNPVSNQFKPYIDKVVIFFFGIFKMLGL